MGIGGTRVFFLEVKNGEVDGNVVCVSVSAAMLSRQQHRRSFNSVVAKLMSFIGVEERRSQASS